MGLQAALMSWFSRSFTASAPSEYLWLHELYPVNSCWGEDCVQFYRWFYTFCGPHLGYTAVELQSFLGHKWGKMVKGNLQSRQNFGQCTCWTYCLEEKCPYLWMCTCVTKSNSLLVASSVTWKKYVWKTGEKNTGGRILNRPLLMDEGYQNICVAHKWSYKVISGEEDFSEQLIERPLLWIAINNICQPNLL